MEESRILKRKLHEHLPQKAFNSLKLNTIPVVLGGADYDNLLPPGSFINARDFYSPEHLAHYLLTVLNNSTLFRTYFEWRSFYNIHRYRATSFDDLPNSPGVSQHVYFHVCMILVCQLRQCPRQLSAL